MFGGIARFSQQSFLKDKWAKWAGKLKISQLFRESAKKKSIHAFKSETPLCKYSNLAQQF